MPALRRLGGRHNHMPIYTPPLRDMQFVMHEVLKVADDYQAMPRHADVDVDTINAIIEEGGKFAREVTFPLNISGAVEFDDREGPVREALVSSVMTWHAALRRAIRAAREQGHLRADVNDDQILFEIHGLILALHYEARLLKHPGSIARANAGFDRILAHYGSSAAERPMAARPARPHS